MQWNMLAKALYSPENDQPDANNLPSDLFDWTNYRFWRTLQELVRYKSDIICVEEIDTYEEIKPYLHAIGYTSIFCPKFQSPCLQMPNNVGPDGSAIFFRKSLFQIVNLSCEKVILDDYLPTSQVFIILTLKHLKSNKQITLVCVHLKSKEEYHEKRADQMKYILNKIKQHLHFSNCGNLETDRIIICGDFNGEPFEKFYKLIVNNDTDEYLQTNLEDAYTITEPNKIKQPTTIKYRKKKMIMRGIDYVFFNKNTFRLVNYLELPKNNELINKFGLPNLQYSSDHLSLVCDFEFKN